MIYIFDNTETLITTLPDGSFFDAVHSEVLNGENTFEFTIPTGSDYVVEGNLVAFRDLDSYWQVFEIKRLVDTHGDDLTRTAYCEHIFYELLDDIVTDKRPSAGATAALAGMLENTRWQVGIVDDLGASSTSAYYEPALSAVQKVAEAWQGELNWRCVVAGGAITRYVDLLAQRGTDTGKQFAYSKDILNIEREVDSSGVVTALYGRGKGIELDSGSYGRRLTFADVVAADKPAGQEWISDNDALAQWGRPGGRHRFNVFTDEEETDPVALLEKTRAELARRKVPRVTYRMDVVSLEQLTGYEHEKVRLGDLVRVIDREFTPELVVSARVIDIERDILDPANTKVVLGSFAPTIVEATINTARRVDQMANRPFNTKWLDGKISVLQNAIENTQSYVFQTADDGILILDAADYATATKAMKLGGGIFAIANQKDGQGGWNWRTFGDGSGFTADLITAGMIDAGLIQVGPQTTFAPGYDPSQIEGASTVGMGVDADCLGLWHFDGSLNSHKGVAAVGDESFNAGCFGQAVEVTTPFDGDVSTGKESGMSASSMYSSAYSPDNLVDGSIVFGVGTAFASASGAAFPQWHQIDLGGVFSINKVRWINNRQAANLPKDYTIAISETGAFEGEEVVVIAKTGNTTYSTWVEHAFTAIKGRYVRMTVSAVVSGAYYELSEWQIYGTRLGVLKAPTTGLSASQGTISFRAKNLAESVNGSVLMDLPKSDNTQGIKAGITNDTGHIGELFLADSDKVSKSYSETTQADFNSGTVTDVIAASTGDLELAADTYNYGSDFTGGKTYSADSNAGAGYDAIYAFDDNETTRWQSAQTGSTFPRWVRVDLGSGGDKIARKLRLKVYASGGYAMLKNFKLQGSNGDGAWPDIFTGTVENNSDWQEFTFSNNNAYRYYRIYGLDNYHPTLTTICAIHEIELMEGTLASYKSSGTREKIVDLSGANPTDGTKIEWEAMTEDVIYSEEGLGFDGVDDYIRDASYSVFTGKNTMAAKVRIKLQSISSGTHRVLTVYDGFTLGVNYDGRLGGLLNVNNSWVGSWDWGDADKTVPMDEIVDLLFTYDGSKIRGYIDGVLSGEYSVSATSFCSSLRLEIGGDSSAQRPTKGVIYEVELFDDVAQTNRVGHWKLDEGAGDTAYDSSVNGNDCTIYGASWISSYKTDIKIETALSLDGGSTYESFTEAANGSSIPGITSVTNLSNARLKIKETLTTTDTSVTPKLHSLSFNIWEKQASTVYGPNKSTLTAWDSIALAWKPDRLSLVVNDAEACYIENPGLPTAFGSHVFIGTDRNGANAINTLVDELRIDKVYRDVNIRTGWHKTGVPFYTSEDMKQWPGYLRAETDGLKVYDSSDALRVLVGSWLEDAVRKYGIKIIGGEIYSSLIRTGVESDVQYIAFEPPNTLAIYARKSSTENIPIKVFDLLSPYYAQGNTGISWWDLNGEVFGNLLAASDNGGVQLASLYGKLTLMGKTGVDCFGDFRMTSGTKYNVEQTENYGTRGLAVRESPEQKYIDEGFGTLEKGICRIDIDPIFMECIEPHTEHSKWHIHLTPYADVDIYVAEIGENYFVVKEKKNGTSTGADFTWSLSAIRKNYAGIRLMEVID